MPKIERTIIIDAPVEKVFNYVHKDPSSLLEIWPSLVEVKDVERLPNGGNRFRWVYNLAGVRLEGTSEDIEYIPNQHVVSKTKGGVDATYTWTYDPEDGGTRMTEEVEYTVPIPVLGRVAEAFIIRANEREADLFLANLKDKMEA